MCNIYVQMQCNLQKMKINKYRATEDGVSSTTATSTRSSSYAATTLVAETVVAA